MSMLSLVGPPPLVTETRPPLLPNVAREENLGDAEEDDDDPVVEAEVVLELSSSERAANAEKSVMSELGT